MLKTQSAITLDLTLTLSLTQALILTCADERGGEGAGGRGAAEQAGHGRSTAAGDVGDVVVDRRGLGGGL